jgi:hypothetical protein
MASSSNLKVGAFIIETENSTPTVFAKDQRSYKYDDLTFAIENPVDFESLRVNGFSEIKDRFERQGMLYYFDVMNGPTYSDLVKEFWMKASIITKDIYNERIKELIRKRPELEGKTPKEMGLRPYVSTEIESFVAGFRVSIRLVHIYEALKLSGGGLLIRSTEDVGSDVDGYIYKPKVDPKDKLEMTDVSKVIYKILIDSILSKLGGIDQVSNVQKLFTFHVGKGNFLDIGKLIFIHLVDSITSSKPIIRHGRLLSHLFAQCGLLDAIKPFFPSYGMFLVSSKIINSTTLRYLKLVKHSQIVHPTNPPLLREYEENIAECRLVHVSDMDARKIAKAHAEHMKSLGAKVGSGETQELTVRQSRMLEQPTRVYPAKRKAAKSPRKSVSKKVKTQTVPKPKATRKAKVQEIVLTDVTEEEKEQVAIQAALDKVEAFNKKQEDLKDTYEAGIDPKEFDDMYSKLPPRDDALSMDASQTLYGPFNAKLPEIIVNSSSYSDVFRKHHTPPIG